MAVGLYMDVHVPGPLTDQLRLRGVDVLTVPEDGLRRFPDEDLLERARVLGRVIFTHDIRFRVLAEEWQRLGKPFAGLGFAHPLHATIGQLVSDLELLAKASDSADRMNTIEYLPF